MARIRLTVLVHENWRDRFSVIVENCRLAGLAVERELVTIGVITGNIDEDRVSALAHIEGVSAVETERVHRGFT